MTRRVISIVGLTLGLAVLAPVGALGKAGGRVRLYRSTDFGFVVSTTLTPTSTVGNSWGRITGTSFGEGTYTSKGTTVKITGSGTLSYRGPHGVTTAANGDKLFFRGIGHGTFTPECVTARTAADGCVVTTVVVETWTGGTGRFKGASGTAIARSSSYLISSDGTRNKFANVGSIIGTIRY